MMRTFDVIIPVFNGQATLERCLSSLTGQVYDDFHVWMIDDGSTDNSSCICQDYVEKDLRFHYLFQKNAGPSAARNHALDHAEAEYVVFIDCDDYVDQSYLALLLPFFEEQKADVVFIGYEEVSSDGNRLAAHTLEMDKIPSEPMCLIEELYNHQMFGNTWLKAFRRSCIGESRFKEGMHLFEDELFTCQVLADCKQMALLNQVVYSYVVDQASALTKRTHKEYCDYRSLVFDAWQQLFDQGDGEHGTLLRRLADQAYDTCKYYYLEHDVDEYAFLTSLKKGSFLSGISNQDDFYRKLMKGNFKELAWMKKKYQLKNRLVQLIRKKK